MIVISICADDLKPHLKKSDKNGKYYVSVVVDERQTPDNYGNTHTAYISQSKEQRAAKEPKQYVGSGKEFKFNSSSPTPETTTHKPQSNSNEQPIDDLPF
jgi:hypothetical protein